MTFASSKENQFHFNAISDSTSANTDCGILFGSALCILCIKSNGAKSKGTFQWFEIRVKQSILSSNW